MSPPTFGSVSAVAANANAAVYDCTFTNKWSEATHPNEYPANAHWSPPVLVAASRPDFLWAEGDVASQGIKEVAETGNPDTVVMMVTTRAAYGDHKVGVPMFNNEQQMQEIKGLKVDGTHKYISYASMIAPSPDWITGFTNVVPISADGFYYDSFTVTSQPYDAGTDSGVTFTSADQAVAPRQPIMQITSLRNVLAFGDRINPMAEMKCTRDMSKDVTPVDSSEDVTSVEDMMSAEDDSVEDDTMPVESSFGPASTVPANTNAAVYDCTFTNLWSEATHPNEYPEDAHWSPPVLVAASKRGFLWREGKIANKGIKDVAETGNPAKIVKKIEKKKAYGDHKVGVPMFNNEQQMQEIKGLKVDGTHKYISYASMIAPSPDWITGFTNVVPISADGFWYDSFTVVSQPYDAGTDSGVTFTSENQATMPQQAITEITNLESVLASADFKINPMAQMKCTRQVQVPEEEPECECKESKCKNIKGWSAWQGAQYDCEWLARDTNRCFRYGLLTDKRHVHGQIRGTTHLEACCACRPETEEVCEC